MNFNFFIAIKNLINKPKKKIYTYICTYFLFCFSQVAKRVLKKLNTYV